ncbi:hypothetical protein IGJ55_002134 [Enterococcus sp. AZ170]|uniref:tyrosine-type recombinase/integrase n=1 Tax=Enterococcus sp. AZ170 TaxID=2774747 RepID=UPI003D2FCC9C
MAEKMKGSVEQLPSGKYRLRVTVGRNANGNPKRLSKTVEATNIRKAYVELDKWIDYLEENGYEDLSSITFKNFYDNMWKDQAKHNLELRTYHEYISIIDTRFLKKLGDKKMIEIKPYQIKDIVINTKRLDGKDGDLSRKTRKRFLAALSNLFSVAHNDYRLIERNPVNDVKLPKVKNVKKNIEPPYSIAEITQMLTALDYESTSDKTKAIILTAFVTGAREGEIAALEEKHFDFKNSKICFEQRIVLNDKSYMRVDGLKVGDQRILDVPSDYLEFMYNYIQTNVKAREQLNIDPKHKYIFGSVDGNFERPTSLYRNFRRFLEKNELRLIRFHDLRHTTASFLLSDPNITIKTVQEHLGHQDYRTTANIYSHALEESKKAASDKFGSLLHKND